MDAIKKWALGAGVALACAALAGCQSLGYLAQAAAGQASLMSQARPIGEWAEREDVKPGLKKRLASAQMIRRFAVSELGLPDNESYTTYADVGRPFVLWNVVATPELSVTPKKWCFPIAGCVSYKGYYDKKAAQREAARLRSEGHDAQVEGVAAYSTLGWLKDPLISTFIHRPEADLAGLMFHELAHQTLYEPGDTQFNESFASAVEQAGVERWLALSGASPAPRQAKAKREAAFLKMLMAAKEDLRSLYASSLPVERKRAGKKARFERLKADYAELKRGWGGFSGYDRWFETEPSNASLASAGAYHEHVAAFRELMAQEGGMPAFYNAARALAKLGKKERQAALEKLADAAERRASLTQGPALGARASNAGQAGESPEALAINESVGGAPDGGRASGEAGSGAVK